MLVGFQVSATRFAVSRQIFIRNFSVSTCKIGDVIASLKVVTNEKEEASGGVLAIICQWGVVLEVFFVILWDAILYEDEMILPRVKQKRIVFAANNSMCCECLVAPTIIWSGMVGQIQLYKPMADFLHLRTIKNARKYPFFKHWKHLLVGATNIGSTDYSALTMSYSHNSLC